MAERNDNQPNRRQQPMNHLTSEELRILKECNRESFYYRSVPLAVGAMAATYFAVQRGIFKPHPKHGSVLKYIGSGFLGWLVGKISYRGTCEEKFLNLENSPLADSIRKSRGLAPRMPSDDLFTKNYDKTLSTDAPGSDLSDKDYHSSFGSLNLDTDKNAQYSDLDDRPSKDKDSFELPADDDTKKPSATYDDLRRQNREKNAKSPMPTSSQPAAPLSKWDDNPSSFRLSGTGPDGPSQGTTKNTYGDSWEK